MPLAGGVFKRLFSWQADQAAGKGISATEFDQDGNDVALALSDMICRDGQSTVMADIPWNGFGITGLRAPAASTDADTFGARQAAVLAGPDGCCRLSVASANTLLLAPLNGTSLNIAGVQRTIPAAGVTYVGTLAASTLYYVYAMWTGSAIALYLSALGWQYDANGRAVLFDGSNQQQAYRLVGMVRTSASSQFVDATNARGCLNFFNRRTLPLTVAISNTTGSTTPAALIGGLSFLSWGDETTDFRLSGYGVNSAAGMTAFASVTIDGTAVATTAAGQASAASSYIGLAQSFGNVIAEGAHTVNVTGSVAGSGSASFTLTLSGLIRG